MVYSCFIIKQDAVAEQTLKKLREGIYYKKCCDKKNITLILLCIKLYCSIIIFIIISLNNTY